MTAVTRPERNALRSARASVGNRSSSFADSRKSLVRSLRGSLSWVDYSVEQYLAEKHADAERENRQ